jgi:hypothetical protein
MTPPRICPSPPDCPLYAQRLPYADDEPLRRAILRERRKARDLAELVWANFNRGRTRTPAALPPAPPQTFPPVPRPALHPSPAPKKGDEQ